MFQVGGQQVQRPVRERRGKSWKEARVAGGSRWCSLQEKPPTLLRAFAGEGILG